MYNKDFIKYERLKQDLAFIQTLCPNQYFAVQKCPGNPSTKCPRDKQHVQRHLYPCIHYFTGNCKYGMNCYFSHHIRRQIIKPEPQSDTCKKFYFQNNCPLGNKCKLSHDLKKYPCYHNLAGKCRYSKEDCRYNHDMVAEIPVVCFFDLMKGCKNKPQECPNTHIAESASKYLTYQGPI